MRLSVKVGARSSPLSRAQVEEVWKELQPHHPQVVFDPVWVETIGDRERLTSLRELEKTDFFTREIDQMQLRGECRIAIHSAKDLPDPLPQGLVIAALTRGVDPSDSLVLQQNHLSQQALGIHLLPLGARIGTSSKRREETLRRLRPDLICVDIRGTIEERLALLTSHLDGVIIAEAALIRLQLTHLPRFSLPGPSAFLQGRLAVLAREEDQEMRDLFAPLNV